MQKLHWSIVINAPKEKVWQTMLDKETYEQWTKVFNEGGSSFKGDWSEGSKMLFIGPDPKTGQEGGMVSRVAENKPYDFISIEHIGILVDGKEDTTSDEARKWTPGFENYTFQEKDGGTEVSVDLDTTEEFINIMEDAWPKGLQELKALAEK